MITEQDYKEALALAEECERFEVATSIQQYIDAQDPEVVKFELERAINWIDLGAPGLAREALIALRKAMV